MMEYMHPESLWPIYVPRLRSPQFAALFSLFLLLTVIVASGITTGLDSAVIASVSSTPPGPDIISILIIAVASMGDVVSLVIISIILSIIKRTRKEGLILLITILLIVILLTYLKPIVARENPGLPSPFVPSNISRIFEIEGDTLSPLSRDYSYPSNHVAISTAFAFIIGYSLSRRYGKLALLLWLFPLTVAITRILILQHFVTDAVAGFLFGMIISIIMCNAMHLQREVSPPTTM
jgi:undecaprenyl-diphosphatase